MPDIGRRPRSRGDLREERILTGLERLLENRRLRDLTVDEIARSAGITRPTFYFYFDSRYAVLAGLLARVVERKFKAAQRWIARPLGDPPHEAFRRVYGEVLALWHEQAAVIREAAEAWTLDPELQRVWEAMTSQFIDAAAAQIERERRAGVAAPGPDPRAMATALVWMSERTLYAAIANPPREPDDQHLIDALATTWVRAVYGTDNPDLSSQNDQERQPERRRRAS